MEGEDIFVQGGEGRLLGEVTFDLQGTLGERGGARAKASQVQSPSGAGRQCVGGRRKAGGQEVVGSGHALEL